MTGPSGIAGAGYKQVIRWDYRRYGFGHTVHFYVYFDYIDPSGTTGNPVLIKTDQISDEWDWWPWQKAKARA